MNPETSQDRGRSWLALLIPAGVWVLALVHRGEPLAWDEVEFYRATRWIAEGRLPFRDYWEHHMPLQWFLFAPVARVFGGGAGIDSVVALRWAQLILWIGILAQTMQLAREQGISVWSRRAALAMLLTAPTFVRIAVQYRVDVVGNLAFLAGFGLIAGRAPRARYITFGMFMSAAVLANMRLAPLTIAAGLVAFFWNGEERRWRLNIRASWMVAGLVAVAGTFLAFLFVTGSWQAFMTDVVRFNPAFDALVPEQPGSFFRRLFDPFTQLDITAIVFLFAAIAGAITTIRRPGPVQLTTLLAIAGLLVIAAIAVHYAYHFHIIYILLIPAAAAGFDLLAKKWRLVLPAIVLIALIINASQLSFTRIHYQERVMRDIEVHTRPGEAVFDGIGYALRRPSAYRYWFFPSAVLVMARAGKIEPYDLPQFLASPPAAVVHSLRLHYWFLQHPRLGAYVLRHYLPIHRNLWLPGLTAAVGPHDRRALWIVPKTGRYDVHASAILARHPWITRPVDYGFMEGPELEIPLNRLPPLPEETLQWRVDGAAVSGKTLSLKRGSRVELDYRGNVPAGVVVVPAGTTSLCWAPDGSPIF